GHLHLIGNLVRELSTTGHVERSARSRNAERKPGHRGEDAIGLPTAQKLCGETVIHPRLSLAEWQFPYARHVQYLRAIVIEHGMISVEISQRLNRWRGFDSGLRADGFR